jgi:uncharacterized metal-binding protein YceD (DUF177 family)
LSEFDIEFVKLKNGKHSFEYHIDKSFFENFNNSDVLSSNVNVSVTLDRQENMLLLDIEGKGTLNMQCVRCLNDVTFNVDPKHKCIYHLNQENVNNNDNNPLDLDVVYLAPHEFKINLSQYVYESFLTQIPMVVNCDLEESKSCDSTMLEKLKGDSNNENKNETDPRWDALKKLIDKK